MVENLVRETSSEYLLIMSRVSKDVAVAEALHIALIRTAGLQLLSISFSCSYICSIAQVTCADGGSDLSDCMLSVSREICCRMPLSSS